MISSPQLGEKTADIVIILILNLLSDMKGIEHKSNLQVAKVQHKIITTLIFPPTQI